MNSDRGRNLLLLFLIALTASFLAAQSNKSPNQAKKAPVYRDRISWTGFDATQLLQQIDSDHDGVITHDEWERFFKDHDDNKDDRLTPDEIEKAVGKEDNTEETNPDFGREKAFQRLDVNKDDVIERNEWPGNDRLFRIMDANHDGVLSRTEFFARSGRYWNARFEDLDFNGDGIISKDEWLDSEIAFSRLDHDRNGTIDRFEFYTPK